MIRIRNWEERHANVPHTLVSVIAAELIQQIIDSAPNHTINSIYNSEVVRDALSVYHGKKCVYCESIPIASSSFRVDHYRPKKHIKDIPEDEHYGYYWLSLEWTNLLQSCETCNSKKSNKFPVNGNRVNALEKQEDVTGSKGISELPLSEEGRLLLHPEIDHVERHLKFNRDGTIEAIDNSEKGNESIKGYGLNRGGLIWKRKQKVDEYLAWLIRILNQYEDYGANEYALVFLFHDLKNFFSEMLIEQDETREYSLLGYYMFDQFIAFFVNQIPEELDEHRNLLEQYYSRLLQNGG